MSEYFDNYDTSVGRISLTAKMKKAFQDNKCRLTSWSCFLGQTN